MRIEDLRIGQTVFVNDWQSEIVALDSTRPTYTVGLKEDRGSIGWFVISAISLTPPLPTYEDQMFSSDITKKRYYIWDIKYDSGNISKTLSYLDDDGVTTNGDKIPGLIRKHENEWIEV